MDRVTFRCPTCRTGFPAPASLEGEAGECPRCGAEVACWPAPERSLTPIVVQPPPAPKPVWYYSIGGNRRGPVASAKLRSLAESGQLRPDDLVWRDGMPDWVEARMVPGLFPDFQLEPPPLPLPEPRRRRDDDEEDYDRRPRRRRRARRDESWDAVAIALLVVGTLIVPLVGIITGVTALCSRDSAKRAQGGGLLVLGLFMVLVYLSITAR